MLMMLRAFFGRTPKMGDIYLFDDDEYKNPFLKDDDKHLVVVLDVKDGWVKYRFKGSTVLDKFEYKGVRMFRALYKPYKKG